MERNESTRSAAECETRDETRSSALTAPGPSPATIIATDRTDDADESLRNEVTIVGHGAPSSFELTVDGRIEYDADADDAANGGTDATVVSGSAVEGTIDTGTIRFRFDGELTAVTFVDRSITGRTPGDVPNVHVDYGATSASDD